MGYVVGVLLQTVVPPAVCGSIRLATTGGDAVDAYGQWWVFWGVGTRLVVAGAVQLARPQTTAGILGADRASPAEVQVAGELSTATIGMGVALLLALHLAWAAPAGAAGGVFLLVAGLLHVAKKGKNLQERVATWTDLLVGVVALGYLAAVLVRLA